MKKLPWLLSATFLFASCAPKYTTSFQNYSRSYGVNNGNHTEQPNLNASKPVEVPETSSEVTLTSTKNCAPVEFKSQIKSEPKSKSLSLVAKSKIKALNRQTKREIKSSFQEIKSRQKHEGDPKKNDLAIAGFVISIVAIIFWPVEAIAILLSLGGLKSERRGWAIAGLAIATVAIMLGVLLYYTLGGD